LEDPGGDRLESRWKPGYHLTLSRDGEYLCLVYERRRVYARPIYPDSEIKKKFSCRAAKFRVKPISSNAIRPFNVLIKGLAIEMSLFKSSMLFGRHARRSEAGPVPDTVQGGHPVPFWILRPAPYLIRGQAGE